MQLRYQYRVYPTPGQRLRAARVFGCRRVVWNDALGQIKPVKAANKKLGNPKKRIVEGPYMRVPRNQDLSKTLITAAKKTEERHYLKDRSGRYWASCVVETDPAEDVLPPVDGDQGIDLGLTRFAVLAGGSHIASPKYLRGAEKKLKKRQRELSRKKKGSNNRDKARIKVARAHASVADARRNFAHQWSHKLTSENQAVYTETLSVKGLARTTPTHVGRKQEPTRSR